MNWYDQELPKRAPAGGVEEFGKVFKGGEFLPFYIPRMVMPQIDEVFYPQLIDFAREQGVGLTEVVMDPLLIKPHQRVEVDHLRQIDEATLAKPILSSQEPFILDGHHRWWHHARNRTPIRTFKLSLEFAKAIKFLFTFPATYSYGDGHDHAFTR